MKDLTELKTRIVGAMSDELVCIADGCEMFYRLPWKDGVPSNETVVDQWMDGMLAPVGDTEWLHIVHELLRTKLPVDKRAAFLKRLELCDPADLLLRLVVQHWWVLAECYFEVMEENTPTRKS